MANIDKIKFFPKKIIKNPKGNVMHFIKKDDKNYIKFGEVYFTWIKNNNVVNNSDVNFFIARILSPS